MQATTIRPTSTVTGGLADRRGLTVRWLNAEQVPGGDQSITVAIADPVRNAAARFHASPRPPDITHQVQPEALGGILGEIGLAGELRRLRQQRLAGLRQQPPGRVTGQPNDLGLRVQATQLARDGQVPRRMPEADRALT